MNGFKPEIRWLDKEKSNGGGGQQAWHGLLLKGAGFAITGGISPKL